MTLQLFRPKLEFSHTSGGILKPKLPQLVSCLLVLAASAGFAQTTKAQLEVSETFFTVTAALNSCGYDAGLDTSLPLRRTVRAEVQAALDKSLEATRARDAICFFQREHQAGNTQNDVTQYVSLALELTEPPAFITTLPEADLSPDAAQVLGVLPLLRKFYAAAGIHELWLKHKAEYQALVQQFHDPVSEVLTRTDSYLKVPFANYPGQRFVVYLEPMLAPLQVDSRNYGSNYYVVLSLAQGSSIRLDEIRHTYLHFVLEPLALRHGTSMKRLEPILIDLQAAPMNSSFKEDISLLVNECLIRAIETRTAIPKSNERLRDETVQRSVEEGFVLTRYFYDALGAFEKESTGMKDAYGDLLHLVSMDRERKRAREVVFASRATPEVISAARAVPQSKLLDDAEQRLASGDIEGAKKLAEQVLQHNRGGDEPARATFIMARVATLTGNMEEARAAFEQTVQTAHDSRMLAWSHIYLGRIFDIQGNRATAVDHYRAALNAGDPTSDTRAAAERGLTSPYERKAPR